MIITFGAPVYESGVAVPFAPLGVVLWYSGIAAPAPVGSEQNPAPAIVRTLPNEGGDAYVAAARPAGASVPGQQVRMTLSGVWDVVFVDAFEPAVLIPECSLVLEVFEEDGVTVAWEVSTSGFHAFPYLCEAENYGAQELDVIAGAATIGQVEVVVIDKAQIPGDQDSGWLTERLTDGAVPAIRGRRCKLTRYIGPTLGYVVIADGPADTPRMDDSYAAYRWVIRDVRETERKIRTFTRTNSWMFPMGTPDGWGYWVDEDDMDQWLVPPTDPLIGTYTETEITQGVVTLDAYWNAPLSSNHFPTTDLVLSRAVELADAVEALDRSEVETLEIGDAAAWGRRGWHTWPNVEMLWRPAGSADPWTIVRPEGMKFLGGAWISHGLINHAGYVGDTPYNNGAKLADGTKIVAAFKVVMRMSDRNSTWTQAGGYQGQLTVGDFPTEGQSVELALRWVGEPTEALPAYIEYDDDGITRMTAGRLLQKLYDGEYSSRDPFTGDIVPTGIRYDAARVLLMTTPVRLRLTKAVDDLRDWSEKMVYAPTGWIPAFDSDLAISPASQETPSSFDGLPILDNSVVEPVPSWNAGETIINLMEFNYKRWYNPGLNVGETAESIDSLKAQDVAIVYRSASSITHKEEKAGYEGDAFAALGDDRGGAVEGPETGATMAQDRRLHIFDRYNLGAQTVELPVRRNAVTSAIRAGEWIVIDLSWLPDYALRRRGTLWGGQVVAIHDVDCAWRVLLIEESVPLVSS